MLKTIAVFLDARRSSRVRLKIAIDIASRYGVHVTSILVDLRPQLGRSTSSASSYARGAGIREVAEHYLELEELEIAWQRQSLEKASRSNGFGIEWRTLPIASTLREAVVHCRYVDLAILPQSTKLEHGDGPMFWSPGDVVMTAGVPCVFVPQDCAIDRIGRRILIGWNASRESRRAVGDALPLLSNAEHITVLVINAKTGSLEHGEDPGYDVAQFLARHGVRADVERVESSNTAVGDVLLAHAVGVGADLIVAGAYGHSPFVEFLRGSTTRAIAGETSIPILLAH